MILTILAEPRSGSTNLANWFKLYKKFTVLKEPLNKESIDYKKGEPIGEWMYDTEHFLIKEIFRPDVDFSELIEISDKVIILYRENISEQTESWLNANKTNNWDKAWVFKENLIKDEDASYFNQIKNGLKENYLNKDYFNISYEELYYNDGFQRILDYLNMDELKNKNFPYGRRYRINVDKGNTLI
jgi:hypothetical protein